MLTNTILSEKLGIPLTKIRRWTKEFMRPDPKAIRRSGYTRKLTINQSFIVFLGGYLVSEMGLSFANARSLINFLMPWIHQNGLLPDIPPTAQRIGIDRQVNHGYVIYFEFRYELARRWYCRVEGIVERNEIQETDAMGRSYIKVKEKKISYVLGSDIGPIMVGKEIKEPKQIHKILYYTALLEIFNELVLDNEDGWYDSWRKLAD